MKLSNLMMAMGLGLLSLSAVAAGKLPDSVEPTNAVTSGLKADFMGAAYNGQYYVKTDKGVQKAKRLVKGLQVVTATGEPLAVLTGKLVVKLQPDVDAAGFAERYGLRLDWQGGNNLVILAAKADAELLSVLAQVANDGQVIRAKLDHATNKQVPM
ncbi:hypothetical protein [Shewanella sp. YIC-542]|uniref:hypothetical protein n=1 Tax=Shewanella mytili TaxID=3377111 RepID=UPI00398EA5A1